MELDKGIRLELSLLVELMREKSARVDSEFRTVTKDENSNLELVFIGPWDDDYKKNAKIILMNII